MQPRIIVPHAAFLAMVLASTGVFAQEFRWVNAMPAEANERLEHRTYHSELMDVDVGFVVYLPPGYEAPENADRSYPVVYYLPLGRVGSEVNGIDLADLLDEWIGSGVVQPRIHVFVNGGREGYFDYGDSQGESTFVRELIPNIDRTYRTIANRKGRALEGFSMGGRGTARIMFRYPELFCSAAAISGGHQKEEQISVHAGREVRGSEVLIHEPTNNSWDLARAFAARDETWDLDVLVAVGSADPNYQGNLDWMDHLRALGIPFERRIVPGIGHDITRLLEALGPTVERYHDSCFAKPSTGGN